MEASALVIRNIKLLTPIKFCSIYMGIELSLLKEKSRLQAAAMTGRHHVEIAFISVPKTSILKERLQVLTNFSTTD